MRTAVMNDRAMVSNIIRAFLELSTDNTGQMVNAKCVDHVMYDILDQRKFVVRLCRAAKNEMELISLFNGVTVSEIYNILSEENQFMALRQTILLQREIQGLKIKIKKKIKKGSKPKKDQEYCNKLEKIYKKSIKTFRSILGIKDIKKGAKPKDKYAAIVKFNKRYSDDDGFYSYLLDDDFDYDDFGDLDDMGFTSEQMAMMGMDRRTPKYRRPAQNMIIDMDEESDDDEDDDDYEDDLEDLKQEMAFRFDAIDDKFQKLMSGMGKMISIHEGKPITDETVTISEDTSLIDDEEDDEEDLRTQVSDLRYAVAKLINMIQPAEEGESNGRPRPVSMSEPDYSTSNSQDDEDVSRAMEAMFAGDDDEPLKVKGEVVTVNPEEMSTPEVIDARNSEASNMEESIDALVEKAGKGKRS